MAAIIVHWIWHNLVDLCDTRDTMSGSWVAPSYSISLACFPGPAVHTTFYYCLQHPPDHIVHAAEEPKGTEVRAEVTNYLLRTQERYGMSQDGADGPASQLSQTSQDISAPSQDCEYFPSLTKADLDKSLESIYSKIATKFQTELHKSTNTLTGDLCFRSLYWSLRD